MRSTVELDDGLLKKAMAVTHFATKKELLNAGLAELIRTKRIERLIARLGKTPLNISLKQLQKLRADG